MPVTVLAVFILLPQRSRNIFQQQDLLQEKKRNFLSRVPEFKSAAKFPSTKYNHIIPIEKSAIDMATYTTAKKNFP